MRSSAMSVEVAVRADGEVLGSAWSGMRGGL
jgi:hypothetical protein